MESNWKHFISRMLSLGFNHEQIQMIGQTDPSSLRQEHVIRSLLKEIPKKNEVILRRHLSSIDYVVIDSETTGFFPDKGDEIISLSAVKITKGKISPTVFFTYLSPTQPIPKKIIELTGIDEKVIAHAPKIEDVIQEFLTFIGQSWIVGFHISHDLTFLNDFLQKNYQRTMDRSVFEIQKVLQVVIPGHLLKTLDDALDYYSIPIYQRHHALDDSIMTANLWLKILQDCEEQGIVTLFDLYSRISSISK
ncbi:exonuclease domain-containing protein [Tepidibacillus sp. LV47]|uniref:exonuclease domain-containing protein n=1 Tax=Tepidibacillus sp. LV47 TaxID=3398228 RepID=UPI003AAC76BC